MSKTQRLIIILLLVLLPFHAFIVTWGKSLLTNEYLFPYLHGWKEILLVFLGCITGLRLLIGKTNWPVWRWLDYVILVYILFLIGITAIYHQNWSSAIYGFKYDALFLIAYFIGRGIILEKPDFTRLKDLLFISGFLSVLFGLVLYFFLEPEFLKIFGYSTSVGQWQFGQTLPVYHLMDQFSDKIRLASTFSGPNHLGAYLLLFIPLFIVSFYQKKTKTISWGRIIWFTLIFLSLLLALYLTFSRAAWLGLIFEIFIFGLIYLRHYRRIFRLLVISSGIIATILIVSVWIWRSDIYQALVDCSTNTQVAQELNNSILKCSSTRGHIDRNLDALGRIKESPWGTGLGSAGPASDYTTKEGSFAFHPESWYLQNFIETGYLGGLLFILIIIIAWITLWNDTKFTKYTDDKIWILLTLSGLSVMALFLHAWEGASVSISFWLLFGIYNSMD